MKRIKTSIVTAMLASVALVQTGCYGSFALVGKVYEFNGSIDNKFVRSIVFWAMNIIPVYGVSAWVDIVILNLIEFWTDSNPLAMKDGESDVKLVKAEDGREFQITITKNNYNVIELEGPNAGKEIDIFYNTENLSWNLQEDGNTQMLSQNVNVDGVEMVKVYTPSGEYMYEASEEGIALARKEAVTNSLSASLK